MPTISGFKDQLKRKVEIPFPPKRIVSIVPSQTELLFHLGLDERVVGITKFCIHPDDWFHSKMRVGGTKQLNFDKIKQLNPDIIIGNKEENDQMQVEQLMELYPVWMSDVKNLQDALIMIEKIGKITDKQKRAFELSIAIKSLYAHLQPVQPRLKVAYLIWQKPYMAAGGDTFVNDMLLRCGFENIFENHVSRYPEISTEELTALNPDIIFLSSEPYPFKEKHVSEFNDLCPKSNVMLVDGEMFSWYGSRLLRSIDYLHQLTNVIK